MNVLRLGPCGVSMTLPSGPIAGSRSGREGLVSAAVAPGGGAKPALRPPTATPSAATSAPITTIRARHRPDEELNSGPPQLAAPYQIGHKRRQHGETIPFPGERATYQCSFAKALSHRFACRRTFFGAVPP